MGGVRWEEEGGWREEEEGKREERKSKLFFEFTMILSTYSLTPLQKSTGSQFSCRYCRNSSK